MLFLEGKNPIGHKRRADKPKSLPCSRLEIVVGVDVLAVGKTESCCGGCGRGR
jgi:hypothetical protein